jgi:hypothetical protein
MWPSSNILQHVLQFLALTPDISSKTPDIKAIFGPKLSPGAEVILRSDVKWTEKVQQRWSAYLAPDYLGAVKVATVEDIQNTVSKPKILKEVSKTERS